MEAKRIRDEGTDLPAAREADRVVEVIAEGDGRLPLSLWLLFLAICAFAAVAAPFQPFWPAGA